MPFAPNVQDRRDMLTANAYDQISKYNYMGPAESGKAIGAGIQAAGSAVAGGISAALEGVQAKAAKYSEASGQLDAYRSYGQQNGMDTSFLDGIEEKYGKDPDKLLGALSVVGQDFKAHQNMMMQEKQYAGALELARQKAALGTGGSRGNSVPVTRFNFNGVDTSL